MRFTKGNAKEKGIVLPPKHITDLICDIAGRKCTVEKQLKETMIKLPIIPPIITQRQVLLMTLRYVLS